MKLIYMKLSYTRSNRFEPQSVKSSLNDEVVKIKLIVLRSYRAHFMKLYRFFMEIWCFEIIHQLKNFNTQRQKCHAVTHDVKVNFLICGFVGCMKIMLFLANMLFILSMCAMEFAKKLTMIHVCLKFARLKKTDHTLKLLTVVEVKLLPWKHMSC